MASDYHFRQQRLSNHRVHMNILEIGALEQGVATLFCKKGQTVVF